MELLYLNNLLDYELTDIAFAYTVSGCMLGLELFQICCMSKLEMIP
jgi:hypothetical protein